MLLNAVILVLQETLEAALLVSVLLTISYRQWRRISWLLFGVATGFGFSFLYAGNMVQISGMFDYVGQEIVNASLQIATTLLIGVCSWALFKSLETEATGRAPKKNRFASLFVFCAAAAVALVITREGSEILLYLSGFMQQEKYVRSVMVGSAIGFSIGLSAGILFYYALSALSDNKQRLVPVILMALFAGNMLSQATLQLTQADWISSAGILWDSSVWLPENSIIGQLLYALVGYEATPSAAQVIAYLVGVSLVLVLAAIGKRSSGVAPVVNQVST